ncbi:MAG: hydrogenase iron-sulfur subunit [Pseudomonadota bacterium]
MTEFNPNIIAFLCNWCSYTGADLAGTSRLKIPDSIKVVRVMCSSRVDPAFIIKALQEGADGVLVGGCHPGDCHYQKGNYYARRRIAALRSILGALGLEPERVRLEWISASEGPRFSQVTGEFTDAVRRMGPSPLRV